MSDAIIAEAQRRLLRVGKHARMRLNCSDILAIAGVEVAKPAPRAPEPEPEVDTTPDAPAADEPTVDEPNTPDAEIPPYGEWTNADLKAECENRNLAKGGTKDELVARLEAHDQSDPDDGE